MKMGIMQFVINWLPAVQVQVQIFSFVQIQVSPTDKITVAIISAMVTIEHFFINLILSG